MEKFILSKLSEINPDPVLLVTGVISKLDIQVDLDSMKKLYDMTGCLVMRNYRGESTLIFGCGNQEVGDYSEHAHAKCYTVDVEISQKSSVIGDLGNDKCNLSMIPSQVVHLIMSEGGGPDLTVSAMKELLRILSSENGVIKWDLYDPTIGNYRETMICASYNGVYHVMTDFYGGRTAFKWHSDQLMRYHKPTVPQRYVVSLYCHENYKPVSDEELLELFKCLNIAFPRTQENPPLTVEPPAVEVAEV